MALHSYKSIALKNHPSILSTTNDTTYLSTRIPDFPACSQVCTNITLDATLNDTEPCLGFLFTHHHREGPQCLIFVEDKPLTRSEWQKLQKDNVKARFWTWITLILLLSPLPAILRNPSVFDHLSNADEDGLKMGSYFMYVVVTLVSQLIVIPEGETSGIARLLPAEESRVLRGVLWGLMCAGLVWSSGMARRHVRRRVREVRMAEGDEVVEGRGGGWLEKVMEGRVRLE